MHSEKLWPYFSVSVNDDISGTLSEERYHFCPAQSQRTARQLAIEFLALYYSRSRNIFMHFKVVLQITLRISTI